MSGDAGADQSLACNQSTWTAFLAKGLIAARGFVLPGQTRSPSALLVTWARGSTRISSVPIFTLPPGTGPTLECEGRGRIAPASPR